VGSTGSQITKTRTFWLLISRSNCAVAEAPCRQTAQVGDSITTTRTERAEELNAALYAIAARSQSAEDLQQFFAAIHNIVGLLMNARNFYVALYDPQSQLLSFPYFVDEQDPTPAPKPLGRGLTEFVLRSGEPLLATPAVFSELVQCGEVELIGASSVDWLGVPLKSAANCIGALVVQSYSENTRFGDRDREILKFVSQQLAAAIEHKRYEEALRRSEARSRSLILSAAFGICRCTLGGRFLDVNPALISMLGYGSVTVRGTGGTPESFVMISHPQEFRRSVQAQIGHVDPLPVTAPAPPPPPVRG